MNFYSISALFATITGFSLVFLSYFKSNKRYEVRIFLLVTLLATIWTLCPVLVALIGSRWDFLIVLIRFLNIFVVFIPPAILHIMLVVSDRDKIKFERNILYICYIISSLFIFVVFSPFFIESINFDKPYYSFEPGVFYNIFSLFFILVGIYGFTKPIIALKTSKSGYVLIRSKYFLIGGLVGVFSALLHFSAIYFDFEPFPHDLLLIGYLLIIAYAIAKYRLMDIRFVISRSILYSILVLSVASSFTFLAFISGQFFKNITPRSEVFVTLFASLIIVIGIDPLKRLLSRVTDRVFYKGKINYQNVLFDIGGIIAREINLTKLAKLIHNTLKEQLKIKSLSIIHKSRDGDFRDITNNFEIIFKKNSVVTNYLEQKDQIIVTEELPRRISELKSEEGKKEARRILGALDELKYSLVVPINIDDNLTAVILMGQKLSGGAYNQEDIDFFNVLSPQIATALEKSRLYQEVQDFNISLQERIDKATKELKAINLTLADKNRYLLALQRITNLITRSLDFKKVTQSIANGIATELGYIGGLLSFINPTGKYLSPVAITSTPLVAKALKLLPQKPEQYKVYLTENDNLGVKAIKTGRYQIGGTFHDFLKPVLPKLLAAAVQKIIGAKTIVAVPVYSENKVIGVIDFVIALDKNEVSEDEKEMMHSLADQIGIVYRNLELVEKIQETNVHLQDANVRLKHLDEAKSEFLSIASHQLRTPLTAIKGYLAMLLDGDFGPLPPKIKRIMKDVFESSERLARLINVFLNVSRIEAGKLRLDFKEINLIDVFKETIKNLSPEAKIKHIKLKIIKPKDAIPKIKVDVDKIKDIAYNLIDNAIKYTPEGSVEILVERIDDFLKTSIKDTGLGIAQKDVRELFAKFVRGEGIARINTDGSGLGLFIAKKLIEAHGGRIWVKSEGKGKGSTFYFTLPIERE